MMAKTEDGANDANPTHAKKLTMGQDAPKPKAPTAEKAEPETEEKTNGAAEEA